MQGQRKRFLQSQKVMMHSNDGSKTIHMPAQVMHALSLQNFMAMLLCNATGVKINTYEKYFTSECFAIIC